MKENIRYIKVFTPYNTYSRHSEYYAYDVNEHGELPFGCVVETFDGLAVIIDENVAKEDVASHVKLVRDIYNVAPEKNAGMIIDQWWNIVLEIHEQLNKRACKIIPLDTVLKACKKADDE